MSQRYPDNRFSRDRSPPRNNAPNVHPSRIANVESRPRDAVPDAPRGPRASNESFRPYGTPRARGIGRADYRPDFREREPFRKETSPPGGRRDFRGGRAWSPPADGHRDFQDQQRDFESGRGRGRYRDSGPGRYAEGRGSHSYFPPRDDGPRGRGQFHFPRARGRGSFQEEWGGFWGRSPSPPGRNRWARSPSPRDRRAPSDRFEDDHSERRGSEKSLDKDDRSRDDDRFRGGDRYQPAPSPTTPQSYRPFNNAQSVSTSRAAQEGERDYQSRRVPSAPGSTSGRERGFDSVRSDQSGKREVFRPEQQARTSSPPRPPEVPAFGSLLAKTPNSENPPWNKWIAPESKQPQPQQRHASPPPPPPPLSSQPVGAASYEAPPPPPPSEPAPQPLERPNGNPRAETNSFIESTSPRLEPQHLAPRAPRAQRRDVSPGGSEISESKRHFKQESPRLTASSLITQSIEAPMSAPTAPAPKPPMIPRDPTPMALRSPPTGPRQLAGAPAGPKVSMSPLAARATLSSPGFNPPSRPRAGPLLSPPANAPVPTGPRAERALSANARPPFAPAGPGFWQWNRPDVQINSLRPLVVPAKREFNSERRNAEASGGQDDNLQPFIESQQDTRIDGEGQRTDGEAPSPKRQKLDNQYHPARHQLLHEDPKASESAFEEDDLDLGDDSEKREKEFQRTKAQLQAKVADLSAPHLRGCSPIRKLNLLSRLALEDLSTFFEAPTRGLRKPTSQRAVSQQEAKSPYNAASDMLETGQSDHLLPPPVLRAPRVPRPPPKMSPSPVGSPELQSLPFLHNGPPTPISDLDVCQENLKLHDSLKESLRQVMQQRHNQHEDEEEDLCAEYEEHYRAWRRRVAALDAEQRARDDAERQETIEAAMPPSATEISPAVPTPGESRRRGLHATDYELEKVLEMSKLEAERAAKEKQERDAVNAKPNWELEAVVPALLPAQDAQLARFADTSCVRDPKTLVDTWELEPEDDDFSQEEHEAMLQNFKDFPKKFGKIAEGLDGRDYKDCISHYYASKWNGQYKPPKDKRRKIKTPRVRSGPNARPRANALISNLNEDSKPDLYDGDDAAAPLNAYTESGRPKRAAAPTFKDKDPQAEQPVVGTPGRKIGKGEQKGERGLEKSGKKPRATVKEPKARRRIQRRDSRSPEKMDIEPSVMERMQPSASDLEVANSLAALVGAGQPPVLQRPNNAHAFAVDPNQSRTTIGPEAGKIQAIRGGHASNASSYWSVQEVEIFPTLIDKYGTDWAAIANEMGTKTHIMVKNYFNRIKSKGPELERSAKEADERRNRGEQPATTGPASTPALVRDQIKSPPQARPLAPTSTAEIIDLENEEHQFGPLPAARNAPLESITHRYPPNEPLISRNIQGPQVASMPQPYTSSSYASNYAPISQPSTESRMYVPREPISTAATPTATQYAPVSRSMKFGPVSNTQPSMSRPAFHSVRPGVEEVLYRAQPGSAQPMSFADRTTAYSAGNTGMNPVPRPISGERSLSDDVRQAQHRLRAPSPPLPQSIRHMMGEPSSRPRSTTYLDPMRPLVSTGPREEMRVPSRGDADRPPQPAAPPKEPRRSNLMSILNDEPSDPPPPPQSSSAHQASSSNPTPSQYGSALASTYAPPPRPRSRIERFEYASAEHGRRPSLTSYLIPSYLQASQQSTRTSMDSRQAEGPKLQPGSFHLAWPPSDEQPQTQSQSQREPAPFDTRAPLRHLDSRFNPSPPPAYASREGGAGSGHSSPFNQRMSLQHLTGRHEPSPPPARSYGYAPPPAQPRESSISHLNPERMALDRFAPPPSVLQPQHAPRSSMAQPPPVMQPGIVSRADPGTTYAPRDYGTFQSSPVPSRPFFGARPSDPNAAAHEHNAGNNPTYDTEKARIWGIPDDGRDLRPADWTQGLQSREPRYGPAGGAGTPSQSQGQNQPQYAPYQPLERTGDRSR